MNFWRNLHPLLRRDKNTDYGSANYAVLSSLADSLSDAERDTIQKKAQLILNTATGLYLDEWGSWFGVTRKTGETDNDYRERIMWYLLVPRSTIEGIITGIKYYLDDNDAKISVYEPWKNIFYTNKSKLNGVDHLQGFYYRYAVIDVRIDRPMSKAIYDAIMAFKPAGVKFYVTIDETLASNQDARVLGKLKADNVFSLEQFFGFKYKGNLFFTFSDYDSTQSPKPHTDLFITNDSHMNGTDVLAGSAMHNLTYWSKLYYLGGYDEDRFDTYRNLISTRAGSYLLLTPRSDTTVLSGSLSVLNTCATLYPHLFSTGNTSYEKVENGLKALAQSGSMFGVYLEFESNGYVTLNGQRVTPGFTNLGFDDITYPGGDISLAITLKSDKPVKLYFVGAVAKVAVNTQYIGLGAGLKSTMLVESITPGQVTTTSTTTTTKATTTSTTTTTKTTTSTTTTTNDGTEPDSRVGSAVVGVSKTR